MATRVRAVVAATSLAIAMLLAAALADAIAVGDTCPCAKSSGSGQCIRFESGTPTSGACTIRPCEPSFKCVAEGSNTHVCLAQAGSGKAIRCKGAVAAGQQSCACTAEAVRGTTPTLMPMQTTPRQTTPREGCRANGDCGAGKVCVSGTCEAAGECTGGKEQECDAAYTRFTGLTNNRAKCCPASSQCVKNGIQAGVSTACSTNCGKKCEPFCSLSKIDGLPLCSGA